MRYIVYTFSYSVFRGNNARSCSCEIEDWEGSEKHCATYHAS